MEFVKVVRYNAIDSFLCRVLLLRCRPLRRYTLPPVAGSQEIALRRRLIEPSIPSPKPVIFFASSAASRLDLFQKTNESLKPPAQVHLMTFCSKFEHVLAGVNSGSFAPDHPLTGEEKRRMKWSGCLWDLLQPEIIKPTGEPHMPEHGSLSPPTIKTTGLHWLVSSMERDTIGAVSTAPE
ncbi:hypothetical protein MUK42_10334 [Musa troglodytarum]|uniref:Uncharacterized protein n=1 Tax=Musa troglodytarum TaxID=320322 RepID=A0A9E7EDT0_9LILI|nr:hypothetical protein MUK42_10334 [Musa troglodytarum]